MKRRPMRVLFAKLGLYFAIGAALAIPGVTRAQVAVVADGIGGVVTGTKGPEAGVWVIAETEQLATRFIKIVVTDDKGRFMLPQLPKAEYKLWVRGYGLVDSKPVTGSPGKNVNLAAVQAPDAKAAAQIYPANYWLSLIRTPGPAEFPGTGAKGNGVGRAMKTQQDWLAQLKDGCILCHQQGNLVTRETGDPSVEGWAQRITMARPPGDPTVGNKGKGLAHSMAANIARFGRDRALTMFSDWTQRIADGAIPAEAPPRPAGIERNVVISLWDWSHGKATHDEISSDRRDPTVNPNGPVYATSCQTGHMSVIDPLTMKTHEIPVPPAGKTQDDTCPHNPMIDQKSRVWLTDIGAVYLPSSNTVSHADFCYNPTNPYAKYWPIPGKFQRGQIAVYDPADKKWQQIPNCFIVHHLMFANDKDNTLYFSGDEDVIGWLNTRVWDETHDASKAEGWCPMVLDTSEGGGPDALLGPNDVAVVPDRTKWNAPLDRSAFGGEGGLVGSDGDDDADKPLPVDPKKDSRMKGFKYGVDINYKDGSVWLARYTPLVPGGLIRFDKGARPPETCKTEYYEPPKRADGSYVAYGLKGVGVDSRGIVWAAFNSGQYASFDRDRCKVTRGPTATGQQCPEGWTFYQMPGPTLPGTVNNTSDYYYLSWVDVHGTLGLGNDIPVAPGTNSDAVIAILPESGKVLNFRVPYPMGFFGRGMDGRIDDPNAGWKGRGMWASYNMTPVWHQEGGLDGYGPEIVKFQVRPDPLAH